MPNKFKQPRGIQINVGNVVADEEIIRRKESFDGFVNTPMPKELDISDCLDSKKKLISNLLMRDNKTLNLESILVKRNSSEVEMQTMF